MGFLKEMGLTRPDGSLFWPSFVAPIPGRLRLEIKEALAKEAAEKKAAQKARKSGAKPRRRTA